MHGAKVTRREEEIDPISKAQGNLYCEAFKLI